MTPIASTPGRRRTLAATVACSLALLGAGCGSSNDSTTAASGAETSAATPADTTSSAGTTAASGGDQTAAAPAPSGEAQKSVKVDIKDFVFTTDPVILQTGGKVTWSNGDTTAHNAVADDGSFDTDTIEPGKLGNATFKTAGTYTYICTFHPYMKGTIEVVDAS